MKTRRWLSDNTSRMVCSFGKTGKSKFPGRGSGSKRAGFSRKAIRKIEDTPEKGLLSRMFSGFSKKPGVKTFNTERK